MARSHRHSTLVSLLALVALVVAAVLPNAPSRIAAAPSSNGSPSVRVFTDAALTAAGSDAAQPAQAALNVLAGQTAGPLAGASRLNWQVTATEALDAQRTVVRVRQTINSWPVFGAALALQVENGVIRTASGAYVAQPIEVAKPLLTAEGARRIALNYLRTSPPLHSDIHPQDGSPEVGSPYADAKVRETELVYFEPTLFDLSTPLRGAAFRVLVEAADGSEAATLIVDAKTGKVALAYSEWHSALSRTIRDANSVETLGGTVCAPESGPSGTASADCRAAYTNTGRTYTYFNTAHGRDSFDNNGAPMIAVVRFGTMPNAFWNGSLTAYGPGFATLDVVAHEWTHAVTQYTAGLIYQGQSGAMNESMSDIFGAMVDGDDWLMGDDTPIGAIRSLQDPTLHGQPDRMSDFMCMTGDNGGVHYNSGIPNKLAYLLAQGGTFNGQTLTGIGRPDTAAIFYRTLVGSLTPTATFNQLASALISSAETLYGVGSTKALQTRAAVNAVELDEAWPCGGTTVTPDSYEVDNTTAAARPLVPNGAVAAGHNFHQDGDVDVHVFSATAQTTYVIETSNLGYAADTVLSLYAADGRTLLAMNDDYGSGVASRIAYTAETSGQLYVSITNYGNSGGSGTAYTVGVTASGVVNTADLFEPDNTRATAGFYIVDSGPDSHNFHVLGDEDWLVFAAEAGVSYTISTTDSGSTADTVLELYDENGVLLAENDESAAGYGAEIGWVAEADSDLSVRVTHYSNLYGTTTAYSVDITAEAAVSGDDYEPDNNSADSTVLDVGTVAEQLHSFHRPQDEDWLELSLSAMTGYIVETAGLTAGTDTVLELYNSSGILIGQNDDYNGLASRLLITTGASDVTYYVKVRNYSSGVGRPEMTYVVRLLQDGAPVTIDAQEPDDTPDQASIATPGTPSSPELLDYNFHQAGDNDWVTFTANAGSIYVFETSGLESHADTVLRLFAADAQTLMAYDDDSGEGYASRIVWQAPASGDYYLRSNNYFWNNAGPNTGYRLAISATDGVVGGDDYEIDNTAAQATDLAVGSDGQSHTFHLETDEDWVAVTVEGGRSYDLLTDQLGALADTVLELYDTDGTTLLARNDDARGGTLASRIQWRAPESGTYYLRVLPYGGWNTGSDSDYRIRATPIGDAYEPDDTPETATPIGVDVAAQSHSLSVGDYDWLYFPAQSGTLYQITTSGLGACSDTVLDLYRASDTSSSVAYNDDYSGLASRISWTADADADLYVRVRHYSVARDSACATYSIQVVSTVASSGDSYEPDNQMNAAGAITADSDQSRTIHVAGDSDWAVVSVSAGTRYAIETRGLAACTDTVLRLYSGDGSLLAINDDVNWPDLRSRVSWTAPWSGNLYVNVRDYWSSAGGSDCSYTLRVTIPTPFGPDAYEDDDTYAAATHRITVNGAAEPRTFDTASDQDWLTLTTVGGTNYTVTTQNLGTQADTTLTLYRVGVDGIPVFVAENDDDWQLPDRYASRISWTAVGGYNYLIQVRPWYSTGGREGSTYELRVTSGAGVAATSAEAAAGSGRLQLIGATADGAARVGRDFSVVVSTAGAADGYKLTVDDKMTGLDLVAVEPLEASGQPLLHRDGWTVSRSGEQVTLAVAGSRASNQSAPLVRLRWRVTDSTVGKYVQLPISLTATGADGSAWAAGHQIIEVPVAGDIKIEEVNPSEVTLNGETEIMLRVTGLGGETPKVYFVDTVTQAVQQVSGVNLVEGSTELLRLTLDNTIKSGRYKVRVVAETETEVSTQTLRLNAPDYTLFVPSMTR